ncbi:hypothetical protein [Carnobacterium maltaromaticum]|uniref:hypothetical protein n=1 Tax=Carnobacterium maltaromaticum TaxID=2751 RepID=UPI00295EF105|nr:hypothetical protein [Carnobacterium maltaromaticum]
MNLLKELTDAYQTLCEGSQKVLEKITEGTVSILFLLILMIGIGLVIISIRMFRKIKRIKATSATSSESKKERKKINRELYFGIYDKSGNILLKRSLWDKALVCLVVGILIILASFLFFIELASVLILVFMLIILPIYWVSLLLLSILWGIKVIKDTNTQLNKLEKNNKKEKINFTKENKPKEKLEIEKEDEND